MVGPLPMSERGRKQAWWPIQVSFKVLLKSGGLNDLKAGTPSTTCCQFSDEWVARCNALFVSDKGCQTTVHPNGEQYPIQEISIALVATMWTYPENGQALHPQCSEALYLGDWLMWLCWTPTIVFMQWCQSPGCTWPLWCQVLHFILQPKCCVFHIP